jgi:hypothetical protein
MDGTRAVLAGGGEQATARARCWLGDHGGREADFSAAPLTKNVIGFGRNDGSSFGWKRTDNGKVIDFCRNDGSLRILGWWRENGGGE